MLILSLFRNSSKRWSLVSRLKLKKQLESQLGCKLAPVTPASTSSTNAHCSAQWLYFSSKSLNLTSISSSARLNYLCSHSSCNSHKHLCRTFLNKCRVSRSKSFCASWNKLSSAIDTTKKTHSCSVHCCRMKSSETRCISTRDTLKSSFSRFQCWHSYLRGFANRKRCSWCKGLRKVTMSLSAKRSFKKLTLCLGWRSKGSVQATAW